MNYETMKKSLAQLTSKEKDSLIETMIGVSGHLTLFLSQMQRQISNSLPVDIQYMMMIAAVNLSALGSNQIKEIIDYSAKEDWTDEQKLLGILKQMNEFYKDKL